MIYHIETAYQLNSLLDKHQTVLVDFWAPWCGPCRMLGPVLDELDRDFAGQATFAKVNVDEAPELATDYGVMSLPTVLVFHRGVVEERLLGLKNKERLIEALGG